MCNIYNHPCKVCGIGLKIHLGDWETSASEIEVFCKEHLPNKDVVIWETPKNKMPRHLNNAELGEIYTYHKVGIRALTENAKIRKTYNHPNTGGCEITEER